MGAMQKRQLFDSVGFIEKNAAFIDQWLRTPDSRKIWLSFQTSVITFTPSPELQVTSNPSAMLQ